MLSLGKYILKRIAYMIVVFLIVSLLMYSLYNLIPSDPARAMLEGQKATLKHDQYEAMYQRRSVKRTHRLAKNDGEQRKRKQEPHAHQHERTHVDEQKLAEQKSGCTHANDSSE